MAPRAAVAIARLHPRTRTWRGAAPNSLRRIPLAAVRSSGPIPPLDTAGIGTLYGSSEVSRPQWTSLDVSDATRPRTHPISMRAPSMNTSLSRRSTCPPWIFSLLGRHPLCQCTLCAKRFPSPTCQDLRTFSQFVQSWPTPHQQPSPEVSRQSSSREIPCGTDLLDPFERGCQQLSRRIQRSHQGPQLAICRHDQPLPASATKEFAQRVH